MSATEQVFTAKQVSERLGLSPAMTRRYGAALEQITGEPIRQHPRDGRQYRADQVATMMKAKAFVEANARLSVAQALTLALGEAPAVATPAEVKDSENVSEALSRALERTLLPELRALREEVAGMRTEIAEARALPPGVTPERIDGALAMEMLEGRAPPEKAADDTEGSITGEIGSEREATDDGPAVRVARWLERRLRGGRPRPPKE